MISACWSLPFHSYSFATKHGKGTESVFVLHHQDEALSSALLDGLSVCISEQPLDLRVTPLLRSYLGKGAQIAHGCNRRVYFQHGADPRESLRHHVVEVE